MDFLTKILNLAVDRPVVDRTGLTGLYNFRLAFAKDERTPRFLPGGDQAPTLPTPTGDPVAPSVLDAIGDLGLRLVPATAPLEALVIDSIARSTRPV